MVFPEPREELKFWDVFVPGGYPQYTYNPRQRLSLEPRIADVLQNLCKLVIVTGHTKSGKTVLVRKVLPPENAIWIDGGMIKTEEEFWDIIIDQLELFQTEQIQTSHSTSSELQTKGSVEGSVLFAKANAELSGTMATGTDASSSASRTVSTKVKAAAGLRAAKRAVVIDDFHYLPAELQGDLIRTLKPLIFEGVPVVIIAIPHRRYDAVKVEKEMTGRISPVDIPLWEDEELLYIPEQGFDLISIPFNRKVLVRLVNESMGSPHLMQEFCRAISRDFVSKEGNVPSDFPNNILDLVFSDTAATIGRPIFEKLARGPQRANRIQRTLQDGSQVDIYELVLHGLAHIRPELITIEYDQLRAAIKEVCAQDVPQLHEISRVLRHMSEIAATDQSSSPVIDFDDIEKKLHITDPFFAFYLRWGDLKR